MPLKILDYSPLVDENGNLSFANRILGTLRFGTDWYTEMQTQKLVISRMEKLLTDRFTLIRNFVLPDEEAPIPLLLVSIVGIWVIVVTSAGGIFQVSDKELLELEPNSDKFIPANPNLALRVHLLVRAFEHFLTSHNLPVPPIEPVLIFTNPGVDVSNRATTIRVVLVDALSRFATGLLSNPIQIESAQIKNILELIKTTHEKPKTASRKSTSSFLPRLRFSTVQWIVLIGMVAVLILSILLLLALILST